MCTVSYVRRAFAQCAAPRGNSIILNFRDTHIWQILNAYMYIYYIVCLHTIIFVYIFVHTYPLTKKF